MGTKNDLINKTMKFGTSIDIVPSSIHKLNPQFSLCDIDVMYMDDNRNMTSIPLNVVKDALYSLYGVPIVGEWLEEEKRFGGHGQSIEFKDGKIIEKVTTKPIGFVTQEAVDNATFIKKKLPNGHDEKTWLHLEKCILWTSRYEEAQSIIDNGASQSMEVNFEDGFYRQDGIFEATKMIFSALCAIGVEPCFEEAKISRHYALDEFKQEFKLMLDEYKKSNELGEEPIQNKETNNNPNTKGDTKMDLTKFTTLLSEIKYGDNCMKYSLLGANEENIYVADREDCKLYSVGYAEAEEGVVINWDTKKEADITFTEKSENEEISVFSNILNDFREDLNKKFEKEFDEKLETKIKGISEDAESRLSEMKDNYADLQNSYAVAKEKLDKFEALEAEKAKENHINAVKETLERFEKKIGKTPEFIYYKAKVDYEKVDIDAMEKELTLMTGDILMNKKDSAKTFSYNPTSTNVKTVTENETTSRYGNLLDAYMN